MFFKPAVFVKVNSGNLISQPVSHIPTAEELFLNNLIFMRQKIAHPRRGSIPRSLLHTKCFNQCATRITWDSSRLIVLITSSHNIESFVSELTCRFNKTNFRMVRSRPWSPGTCQVLAPKQKWFGILVLPLTGFSWQNTTYLDIH